MNLIETIISSLQAIKSNRLRSSLTILGVLIGVTSVILLVSIVSGLQRFITDQISSLGPNVMYVVPGKIGGGRGPGGVQTNKLTLGDAQNIKSELRDKVEVSAGIQKVTTAKYQNKTSLDMTLVGVEPNYPLIIKSLKITEGRLFNSSEANSGKKVVVIGPTVSKNLFNSGSPLGKSIQIGNGRFEVIGVMATRGSNVGIDLDNFAMIPLVTAQRQFGEDKVHNILVLANNSDEVKLVQQQVKGILGKHLADDDFTVQTQEQTLSTIGQISGILTLALGGIAAISLVVGGIGVMNIMLVSVTERTREIGLRKALGAKPHDIRNQFLIEAVTLSSIGGLIGIILGITLSLIVNQFLQTYITTWSVILSFGFSLLVGIIFGVTPAVKASKLNPIQALRYE
jgi:putative ABC transport system permease protein